MRRICLLLTSFRVRNIQWDLNHQQLGLKTWLIFNIPNNLQACHAQDYFRGACFKTLLSTSQPYYKES